MRLPKKLVALAILGSLTTLLAEAIIDEQIQQIQNAPAQERVQLMNQFKIRLRSMNEADREQAISALRTKTMQQQQVKNMQEDSQLRQKNQVEQMNQVRTMNQWNSMGKPNSQSGGSGQNPVKIPMH
ncbi:hypothetical protein KKA17_05555 [bacterium]|nr:hypothetical protein [bacterium]MBU1883989.1 hypothetical protein [bacterium]